MSATGIALYALVVGVALATSAALLERALTTVRLPARWVWIGTLGLTVWLPIASVARQGEAKDSAPMIAMATPVGRTSPLDHTPRTDGARTAIAAAVGLVVEARSALDRRLAAATAWLPRVGAPTPWFALAWSGSSLLVVVVFLAGALRLRQRVRGWPVESLRGRQVRLSPDFGPATVGIVAPAIVLPQWANALPPHELELILRHENEHIESRDTLLLTLALGAVVACPWNPLVWWQAGRLKASVEVDCDRRVLRHGVAADRYGSLLLMLGCRRQAGSFTAPTMVAAPSLLERRLTAMKSSRARGSNLVAATGVAAALLLVGIACSAEAPVAAEPEARDASSGSPRSQVVMADAGVVDVRVDQSGAVRVNGTTYRVDELSDALAPLHSDGVVTSVQVHAATPYRHVAAVSEQLRAAGFLRVLFTSTGPEARQRPRPEAVTTADHALAIVLPEMGPAREATGDIPSRNLMFLEVLPGGVVRARRGEDVSGQMMRNEEVEGVIRFQLARNGNLITVLRVSPDAEYREMYDVLDAIQRAGATRYSLQLAD